MAKLFNEVQSTLAYLMMKFYANYSYIHIQMKYFTYPIICTHLFIYTCMYICNTKMTTITK